MVTTKETYQSWLANDAQDKVFWRRDGGAVNNLEELAAALREMPEETFATTLLETRTISAIESGISSAMGL